MAGCVNANRQFAMWRSQLSNPEQNSDQQKVCSRVASHGAGRTRRKPSELVLKVGASAERTQDDIGLALSVQVEV